ncbi:MBL fold metallo-hydrolase [Rhodospirillales bacterium TMPK1]|uniref:MBL fold metallo-hydrolase n=2 Tax=Roseiterribacter gracilis TaxID=2812848 RepID=A0A8S8XE33_9PROT|nr:MBL fold metallo-hydrolase [Rhodospirillales bacterium TMPK1]
MTMNASRRHFLGSAAAATALFSMRPAAAAPVLKVPEIDRLEIRIVIDSGHELYLDKTEHPLVKVERSGIGLVGNGRSLQAIDSQWGLSLHLKSTRDGVVRQQLLDFGSTPDVMLNNFKVLGLDAAQLDGLILSHGHGDHYGGLIGFLEAYRANLRPNIPLVVGGEDNFCFQLQKGPDGQPKQFTVLDRADLQRLSVNWSTAEKPRLIGDHAFSTGAVPRTTFEKVQANTLVEYGQHDGAGCDAGHFSAAELKGNLESNQHWHEHATCFHLRGRGLVMISSCGHGGMVNAVRQAQKVSGIQKVHALIGGFHLYPAQASYVTEVAQAVKALQPDLVLPMHCSGTNFVAAAHELMPDQLITSTTGNRLTLGV